VVHLAAESHVDRSISNASHAVRTNVVGTQILLAAALRTGIDRFVCVSTDEVYGPVVTGVADEFAPLRPTVPYAASKAAADLIALSYHRTYGLPVCVTRCSNNYGPRQHPEKIIPLFVSRLLRGETVTIHGEGRHVRNWLHVEDHCAGLEFVLRAGRPGEVYNIGGGTDLSTIELTDMLLSACGADTDCVTHIPDRPCNDIRYAMSWDKIATELGYRPRQNMREGLQRTVQWYRAHPERWAPAAGTRSAAGKVAV
jgi:dTDP-glucose 4,6-dehydratase